MSQKKFYAEISLSLPRPTGSLRRAPPPVPPRTTSKPLISVTLQSSTESAQDTYLDEQDRGSEANSQSGCSNSSDSLCSIRTGSLAKGAQPPPVAVPAATTAGAVPPVPAPRDLPPTITVTTASTSTLTQPQNDIVIPRVTLDQPPTAPKRKLSSIGIQVRFVCLLCVNCLCLFFFFFLNGGSPFLWIFSGGLRSSDLQRGKTITDCSFKISVNWSPSGERQAVSRTPAF